MARTKQTARKSTPGGSTGRPVKCQIKSDGDITIVNESSHSVTFTLGKRVVNTEEEEGNNGHQSTAATRSHFARFVGVQSGTTSTFPLGIRMMADGNNGDSTSRTSWTLAFSSYGVLWRGDTLPEAELNNERKWEILVVPNGTYHVVDDPENPPITEEQIGVLTQEQFETTELVLLRVLQQADPYHQIWSNMCQRLPQSVPQRRHPEILRRAYENGRDNDNRRIVFPYWQNRLALVRRPDVLLTSQTDIDKAVAPGGMARVDVYWRALERSPGGNTDTHTVCYTFDCATRTVSTRTVHNWDGSVSRNEYTPSNLSSTIQQDTAEPSFADFLQSLRALGPGDSECTILDTISQDSDEYDTTWSSHEIIVSLPRQWTTATHYQFGPNFGSSIREFLLANNRGAVALPAGVVYKICQYAVPLDYVPVTRLHQRCIFGSQWRAYHWDANSNPEPEILPTSVQATALQITKDLVGMGKVNTWNDAGDGEPPCPAACEDMLMDNAQDKIADHQFYLDTFLHPLYFNFPARNTTKETIGTSRMWNA